MLAGLAASTAMPLSAVPLGGALAQTAKRGGTLTTVAWPAPSFLNSGITTSGPEAFLGPKFYDGLLGYDFGMKPKPSLALSWSISADGKEVTFKLRPDVKWHDGKPFTSADVAFSFMNVLKVVHGRGRAMYANLQEVRTPDPLTAVFVLGNPSAAMMKNLDGRESPILPRHLYEGTNIMENPVNVKPVGTGAYRLVSYERGANVVMERNPDYWDKERVFLDRIIVQYVPDAATRTAMMESGQADLVVMNFLPGPDTLRLAKLPKFEMTDQGYESSASSQLMDFNLDSPILKDVRVRQAIAHAIDTKWIAENVWYGLAEAGLSPLHPEQKEYYTTEGVPAYAYDLKKAEALLEEAGHKRGAGGVRFRLNIDPSPYGNESLIAAEYMKEQFRQIGIDLRIRAADVAVFIKRVWTDRDFDLCLFTAALGADPTIGVQRFYWSKNFKPGVAFSNGSHYVNAEVDALLEATQVELDPVKRKAQFVKFQQLVMRDLPSMPIVASKLVTVVNRRVKNHTIDALGPAFTNLSGCWIDA